MVPCAIVRNPCTRLASLYRHRRRKGVGGTDIAFADRVEVGFARADPRYARAPAMQRPCGDPPVEAVFAADIDAFGHAFPRPGR